MAEWSKARDSKSLISRVRIPQSPLKNMIVDITSMLAVLLPVTYGLCIVVRERLAYRRFEQNESVRFKKAMDEINN